MQLQQPLIAEDLLLLQGMPILKTFPRKLAELGQLQWIHNMERKLVLDWILKVIEETTKVWLSTVTLYLLCHRDDIERPAMGMV